MEAVGAVDTGGVCDHGFLLSSACCLSQPASWSVSCPMDRNTALMMGSRLVRCLDAHVCLVLLLFGQKSLT